MRRLPPWSDFPKYPIVSGTIALAVAVTCAWWFAKLDILPLIENAQIRRGQLWRLLTSALPHTNILHLAFNVYWTWAFGTLIEASFGHVKTLVIFVLLAAISAAAEYAVLSGGVGLSGVGYGLFGLLWVLSHRDRRFAGAIDPQTIILFIVWFFVCIAMTMAGAPVANVAHGVGALAGAVLGWAVSGKARNRLAATATLAILAAGSLAGAVFARPWINLSPQRGQEEAYLGYESLIASRNEEALRWLRDATIMKPQEPKYWVNLGIAYGRLHRSAEAHGAFKRAYELDPSDASYQAATQDSDDSEP